MFKADSTTGKIRYGVVGAGWFGQAAILPSFAAVKENSQLVAIISGDGEKREELGKDYEVDTFSYEDYPALLASGKLDAVYIATPNALHEVHAVAAAKHGIHVLCEKPLSDTVSGARNILDACADAGVLLMTAYRLHFEKSALQAIEEIKKGTIGEPRLYTASFTQHVDAGNTRLNAELGGHPLLDIGVYAINAARYLFRAEPTEVVAYRGSGSDPKFKDVPEMVTAMMRFPGDRMATIACGFGAAKVSACQVTGTKGDVRLDPAFASTGERTMHLTVEGHATHVEFQDVDQVAAEIAYFSDCIRKKQKPEPCGLEGLIDVQIIQAMLESCERGSTVWLPDLRKGQRPDLEQHKRYRPHRDPELVNAAPPSNI